MGDKKCCSDTEDCYYHKHCEMAKECVMKYWATFPGILLSLWGLVFGTPWFFVGMSLSIIIGILVDVRRMIKNSIWY